MKKHFFNILVLILTTTLSYFYLYPTKYFYHILIISISLFIITLSLGILFLKFNYFITSICTTKNNTCLLTFDDGPDEINTLKILEILHRHQIAALFFIIGKKAEKNTEIVELIIKQGHLIGNHTYSHDLFLAMKSSEIIKKEINENEIIIQKIIKSKTSIFRPPIGYTTPNYYRALKTNSYKVIGWSLRSYDTVIKNPTILLNRLLSNVKSNSIILLHDNQEVTIKILEDFIINAKKKGITFTDKNSIKTVI
jgi:peptidoglycan/xylan/chitin deacetylase (PgdA/CDA1 family)